MANTTDRSEKSQQADVKAADAMATAATATAVAAKSESAAATIHATETKETAIEVRKQANKA